MKTVTLGDAASGAILSDCGTYRFLLWRRWKTKDSYTPQRSMSFVMLNPSTADHAENDPTIRRCIGFAEANQCSAIRVVNLYAFRATKPVDLKGAKDPVGPNNSVFIYDAAKYAHFLVCAWGATDAPKKPAVVTEALRTFDKAGRKPCALALTKKGKPRHPLYLPKASHLIPYQPMKG